MEETIRKIDLALKKKGKHPIRLGRLSACEPTDTQQNHDGEKEAAVG